MPGAFTTWSGGTLKIHRGELMLGCGTPGRILTATEAEGLVVACGEGALRLVEVQPEGRGRMTAEAFLRGTTLPAGAHFGVSS